MESLHKALLSATVVLSLVSTGSGFRCERENMWGQTQIFHCPEAGDDPQDQFCCGFGDQKYCCSTATDEELLEDFFEKAAIEHKDGPHFSPLVEAIGSDKDDSLLTRVKGRLNRTLRTFKEGFDGSFNRLKQKVRRKVQQKVEEKIAKSPVPAAPLALAQVQAGPVTTKQGTAAKLNGTVTAAKDKVKQALGGRVTTVKDKVKAKVNGTVTKVKDKVKQKVKDKAKEKVKQKLNPSGGQSVIMQHFLPTILGVVAAIILTLIVLCVVCCCCCPFCLLYKRRNRGTIHNPNPEVSVMQPLQTQPMAQPPPQQPYPTHPVQPYPTQPMYPAQAGYPPQPYPPQPYPTEQPPMYSEKQPPAYNPTY
ncbi:hypothetical protein GWK47_017999 [Chionoecetes opilio]|uniref:Shisa N-terminal domain-containing protein n=1 Tax=Chionoecetes opilio TaxID=41210 RepID=A0A8J4XQY7_CHIOP|nr:hypothetical protein GWK47_017999 [Chionoecetes opilio]